jgi:hypothetical protein
MVGCGAEDLREVAVEAKLDSEVVEGPLTFLRAPSSGLADADELVSKERADNEGVGMSVVSSPRKLRAAELTPEDVPTAEFSLHMAANTLQN